MAGQNGYILACVRAGKRRDHSAAVYSYSEREHNLVLQHAARSCALTYNIDSDRVFLFGLGQGANMAMDVGLAHPDLFAGVIPMGPNPEYFVNAYWRNGQYLPFYLISGSVAGENEKHIRGPSWKKLGDAAPVSDAVGAVQGTRRGVV